MKYDYDLLVIGGGAAGLTAAGMGAHLGAKTLLVEASKLGGDCTWTGCVPSKTLLHASALAQRAREAGKFGLEITKEMDFASVMKHVRNKREEVYGDADDPEKYRSMGVDVLLGRARFKDAHSIAIEKEKETVVASSRYIIIATGSTPAIPPISGLSDVSYITNETVFELKDKPCKLAVIGAGPIGIEMAQAFQRLGTQVTVFDTEPRILAKDDEELAGMLLDRLCKEGVVFNLSASLKQVTDNGKGTVHIAADIHGNKQEWNGDMLMLATGRTANHKKLNLDKAGIENTAQGITVNNRCRTNQKHIYAAGDVTGRYQFTHMSEHMAKVAATNALLKMPIKIDIGHVPWSTFTDPELAHVGATEEELKKDGVSYEVYRFPYGKIDRALTDEATDGLIKICARKWSGKIFGVSIYGKQGGDLISEYALAMRNGVTLRNIADTIHPYPSYGLGVRRAADQWYIKNQSEWQIRLIKWLFRYRGDIPDLSNKNRIL